MTHLKHLLTKPLVNISTPFVIAALIIAVLGFADATYLTIEHYQGVIPPCSITGGCEKVLTSDFSSIAGIPVSLLGVVYYLLVSIGIFAYLDSKNGLILKYALMLPTAGILFSLWFVYLQALVLHAYCFYCLISASLSTILFILSCAIFKRSCASHENI